MSSNPAENTPHYAPLSSEDGFNPVHEDGHSDPNYDSNASGRHVDTGLQPDAYREDTGSTATDNHDVDRPVEGKSLTEHEPGESFKEWIAADVQQTKEDLHIGKKHD